MRAQAETGKAVWGPQSHLGEEGAQTHLALARQGPDGHCWVPGMHLQKKGPGLSPQSYRRKMEQRGGQFWPRQTLCQRCLITEGTLVS